MKGSIESQLKQIKLLLMLIATLLALQFVPSQQFKNLIGIGLLILGCIYAFLMIVESILKSKVDIARDSELEISMNLRDSEDDS